MFSIPYEEDYTLIGTTDVEQADLSEAPRCSEAEADYMLRFVNRYFRRELTRDDIVWSYSGVRALYDDGASTATAATRDYVLQLDTLLKHRYSTYSAAKSLPIGGLPNRQWQKSTR